ncbi:asporin-like [Saccostrea cucullata]|uniref:asporin-like n=1 Tax=Saccostrea cuccullata TaxID=36930 RepID=UPI002ED2500B
MNWTRWALVFCAFLFDSMIEACSPCTCKQSTKCSGQSADCRRKGLTEVPSTLPSDTCELDLRSNEITTIENTTFSSLTNLVYLTLHKNKITTIKNRTLTGLTNLVSL